MSLKSKKEKKGESGLIPISIQLLRQTHHLKMPGRKKIGT